MIYSIEPDNSIRGVVYGDDFKTKISTWYSGQEGYSDAFDAKNLQDLVSKTVVPFPEGPYIAPWTCTVTGAPTGTDILVKDEEGTVTVVSLDSLADDLVFVDAGFYSILIRPPSPSPPTYQKIEVL